MWLRSFDFCKCTGSRACPWLSLIASRFMARYLLSLDRLREVGAGSECVMWGYYLGQGQPRVLLRNGEELLRTEYSWSFVQGKK